MRARGGVLINVEALRIVGSCEPLDLIGRERVPAGLVALADADVFEEIHLRQLCACATPFAMIAPAFRRPSIAGVVSVITVSPV